MHDSAASALQRPLGAIGALPGAAAEDRLPWPHASAVIGVISVGLWAVIVLAVRAALG